MGLQHSTLRLKDIKKGGDGGTWQIVNGIPMRPDSLSRPDLQQLLGYNTL